MVGLLQADGRTPDATLSKTEASLAEGGRVIVWGQALRTGVAAAV